LGSIDFGASDPANTLRDWMADSTGLGYNRSALLISLVLGALAATFFLTNVPQPLLFWATFVLTRPLGATLANSLDKPATSGSSGSTTSRSPGCLP